VLILCVLTIFDDFNCVESQKSRRREKGGGDRDMIIFPPAMIIRNYININIYFFANVVLDES